MSEQTARQPQPAPAGAKLENQYKPVGIAAVNAATLCRTPAPQAAQGK